MNSAELIYRKTAAQGASGFGLLIALYDTLAGNLKRAADFERRNQIEARCIEVNHAILVLGYLQDAAERSEGGALSRKLLTFYASLRRAIIRAQAKRSAEIFEQQMEEILRVRETWQAMEHPAIEAPRSVQDNPFLTIATLPPSTETVGSSSWSA